MKTTIAKEVVLAYPDFMKPFDIYTDASTKQLGSVITQDNRPIAFFSRKLSDPQSKYTVTELELLAIVETLKQRLLLGVFRLTPVPWGSSWALRTLTELSIFLGISYVSAA